MNVVITSATDKEVLLLKEHLTAAFLSSNTGVKVLFHISGVGMLQTCFNIATLIAEKKPDLLLQVGIAGTFHQNIPLGSVFVIEKEYLGDIGVEEDNSFKDLFDLNLANGDDKPFVEKALVNPSIEALNLLQLEKATSVTINEVTTRKDRIEQLQMKYAPTIESMEGAALHYCCLQTNTPFLQIRSISNYVGERDKSKWAFRESLQNLSDAVVELLKLMNNQIEKRNEL